LLQRSCASLQHRIDRWKSRYMERWTERRIDTWKNRYIHVIRARKMDR
jgi:hypothetical protein